MDWLGSNRYQPTVSIKSHLVRVAIIFALLLVMFIIVKNKKTDPTPDPIQDAITSFEVPPEVSAQIFEEAKNNNKDVASLFANYILERENTIFASKKIKKAHKEAVACYEQFILDLEGFPVDQSYEYGFENSWGSERTFGGNRKHYGTDIMDTQNERGVVPIISMSSGVVENIGWNDAGGYRVGVRTVSGAYIYYAHLDNYASNIEKGSQVVTGDLLGYMGDSGYGKEGTVGEFPVHLHIGIAINAFGSKETWVNPYYLLRFLEDKDMELLKSRGIF